MIKNLNVVMLNVLRGPSSIEVFPYMIAFKQWDVISDEIYTRLQFGEGRSVNREFCKVMSFTGSWNDSLSDLYRDIYDHADLECRDILNSARSIFFKVADIFGDFTAIRVAAVTD